MPSEQALKELNEWYDRTLSLYIGSKLPTTEWDAFALKWQDEILPKDEKKDHYVMRLEEADKMMMKDFEDATVKVIALDRERRNQICTIRPPIAKGPRTNQVACVVIEEAGSDEDKDAAGMDSKA